jgi:hypothetical protein
MAALNDRDIWATRLPGSPGIGGVLATASNTEFDEPRVLQVTTAGTFTVTGMDGVSVGPVDLPVGFTLGFCIKKVTAISGGGAGITIKL